MTWISCMAELLPRLSLRLAGLSVQIMLEQDVQTFITWTHGAQPTWLQFHGPGTLLDRPVRLTASPPTPPRFPILLPPPPSPPPPPPVILHPQSMPSLRASSSPSPRGQSCPATMRSQRARRSVRSADQFRDDDLRSLTRSPKRSRTTSASVMRRSRRPFTVFPSKTGYWSITVCVDKLQALLSCFSTSWTEVSFSLCSSPTRTLPLQVCAASAAVNHSCRILQTLFIRPAFSLKSCLALRGLTHSHCSQGCHGMSVSPQIPWLCVFFQRHCDDTFGYHVPALF